MSINKSSLITLGVLLLILVVGCVIVYLVQIKQGQQKLAASPAAESFRFEAGAQGIYTDISGNETNLEQYLGQVLIVHSWASWSPFSKAELQSLSEISKQYADQGVQVVAINRGEDIRTAQQYLTSIGITDEVTLVVDTNDQYYKNIGGYTMPETVLYDVDGEIVEHIRGQLNKESLVSFVEKQLELE